MTKKQARQKKMREVDAGLAAQRAEQAAVQPKPLIITPQVIVALAGAELTLEQPRAAHRGKTVLTRDNAYDVLMGALCEKAAEIEAERLAAEARRNAPKRRTAQPDWRLIAQHPGVDGTTTIIERLPTISRELTAKKSEHTLEEMGL